ncbi:uncharacterized protein MELLADRAFT_124218 [Melampsora larici-populina 98AG31]|uniref:Secreted protein n=1 Tax=Melampsora larici-populina (strain 98AG31 / pathotype 3-4-7) TaxID=747676 RepID=F4RN17_MELLP|nr:uncharacterized protein MELLADRAFT_124218 [Melampsora larici-populina 98AG31]EGG06295.1 secreted protein [Melampsora larici-populina 98AG31]
MDFCTRSYIFIAFGLLSLVQFGKSKHCVWRFLENHTTGKAHCTDEHNTWEYPIGDCQRNLHPGSSQGSNCGNPSNYANNVACESYEPWNGGVPGTPYKCHHITISGAPEPVKCEVITNKASCKEGHGRFINANPHH